MNRLVSSEVTPGGIVQTFELGYGIIADQRAFGRVADGTPWRQFRRWLGRLIAG